jgi:hypothetical protein
MKKTILLLFVLVNIGLLSTNAGIAGSKESDPISLAGNLLNSGTRSPLSPISAFQDSDYIEVTLSRFLGEISVEISDEANNIVYNETINSSTQSNLYIDTVSLEAGEYTIKFTNTQSQYLSGNFVIE